MLCRDNYLVHRLNTSRTLLVVLGLKGTVHPKMKNLSGLFFPCYSKPDFCSSAGHKRRHLLLLIHTVKAFSKRTQWNIVQNSWAFRGAFFLSLKVLHSLNIHTFCRLHYTKCKKSYGFVTTWRMTIPVPHISLTFAHSRSHITVQFGGRPVGNSSRWQY